VKLVIFVPLWIERTPGFRPMLTATMSMSMFCMSDASVHETVQADCGTGDFRIIIAFHGAKMSKKPVTPKAKAEQVVKDTPAPLQCEKRAVMICVNT
jgi:hypothetical protein